MPVPHLRIPFALDPRGQAATVEQDSVGEVAQCVRTLLSTPVGTRIDTWDYGIPDPVFADVRTLPAQITSAIAMWEPRATGARVDVVPADDGSAQISVQIPTEGRP